MNRKTHEKNQKGNVLPHSRKSAELPEYMETLLEGCGVGVQANLPYPFVKPSWLDEGKVKRGQRFAMDNYYGVITSVGMSILIAYAYQTALQPLIYTRKSSSPFTAFKRYVKTILYVLSWYQYDLLEPDNAGHQNMKTVRGMHERVKKEMEAEPPEKLEKKLTNEGEPMFTDFYEEILEDFQACPALKVPICGEKKVHISQTDMAVTQFAFMGMISTFPKLFGIHNASNEDIDAFLHLWRFLGHLLGIEDKYNLCSGDLKTVLQRNRDLLELWLKPSLRTVSRDWLHMLRCMVEGLGYLGSGTDFQVHMVYVCTQLLNIPAKRLKATLSFKQWFKYYCGIFLMNFVFRIPGIHMLHSYLITKGLNLGSKKTKAELQKLEAIVYPYEMRHRVSSCPAMN